MVRVRSPPTIGGAPATNFLIESPDRGTNVQALLPIIGRWVMIGYSYIQEQKSLWSTVHL